jgi:hypothetical protein
VGAKVDANATGTSDVRATVHELVESTADPTRIIAKLHEFVTQRIRYVALDRDKSGVVPNPAHVTLARRFGDCKDKTTLFIAMARLAGLEAWPVITSTQRIDVTRLRLPALAYFDHMVACVRQAGEEQRNPICLDLTDPYSSPRELSGYLQGAVMLDTRSSAPSPEVFPVPAFAGRLSVNLKRVIRRDGKIVETGSTTYSRALAAYQRGALAPVSPEQQQKLLVDRYHDGIAIGPKPEFKIEGLERVEDPVVVSWSTEIETSLDETMDRGWRDSDPYLTVLLTGSRTANVAQPVTLAGLEYEASTEYELPEGSSVGILGPVSEFYTEVGALRRKYERTPKGVVVHTRFLLRRGVYESKELPKLDRFLRQMTAETRHWFELR